MPYNNYKSKKGHKNMKNIYLKYTLLSVAISSSLLFTGCGKKSEPVNEVQETTAVEETTAAITREQFITLYENAKSIYTESPELFTVDADISIIDLPEISDTSIPVSEAITLNEAMQILQEDNIPRELLEELAESKGIISADTRWDEALTKTEAVELLVSVYMDEDGVPEFNFKQGLAKSEYEKALNPDVTNPAEYAAEDYIESENAPVEEEEQQSSHPDVEANVSDLDPFLEDIKAQYERGEISKATYDYMIEFANAAKESADENGNFNMSDADSKVDMPSSSPSSSGTTSTAPGDQGKLPDYAVTKPSGEGDGSANIQWGQGDYSGLEKYHTN